MTSVKHLALFLGLNTCTKSQVSKPKNSAKCLTLVQKNWKKKNRQVFACLTLVKKIENPLKKRQVFRPYKNNLSSNLPDGREESEK